MLKKVIFVITVTYYTILDINSVVVRLYTETRNSPPQNQLQQKKNTFVRQLDEPTLHIWNQHIFMSRVVKESFLFQLFPVWLFFSHSSWTMGVFKAYVYRVIV